MLEIRAAVVCVAVGKVVMRVMFFFRERSSRSSLEVGRRVKLSVGGTSAAAATASSSPWSLHLWLPRSVTGHMMHINRVLSC